MSDEASTPKTAPRELYSKLLDRDSVRYHLNLCALYLAAFQILMNSVVDQLRRFFLGPSGRTPSATDKADYEAVLTRHREALTASCLWLQDFGVLGASDLHAIESIRKHRNEIAHELLHFIADDSHGVNVSHFSIIRDLVGRIDTWWIREVHMTTTNDFPKDAKRAVEVRSGQMMLLDYLLDVVTELQVKRGTTIQ